MNQLEAKLGLIEITPLERVYKEPTSDNLKAVSKINQTYEMLKFVCERDGMALKHSSKKLITSELCEIAVTQNGLALQYVPDGIVKKESGDWYKKLCEIAVKSNGLALQFVPDEMKNKCLVEEALLIGEFPTEEFDWIRFPVAYVPDSFLTKELLEKAVERVPRCLKDIPERRITKRIAEIAVDKDGLALQFIPVRFISNYIVETAIANNEMSIQYAPVEFLTEKICMDCFEKNPAVLGYLPVQYITKQMCINVIKQKCFSVCKLSGKQMLELFGSKDVNYVIFEDIPEELRNDIDFLQAVISIYIYGSLPLLKWNEKIERENKWLSPRLDKRNSEIKPLKKETVEYLLTRCIEPEESQRNKGIGVGLNMFDSNLFTLEQLKTPLCKDIPKSYVIVPKGKKELVAHDFSENENKTCKIYYISDIHIEHQLFDLIKRVKGLAKETQKQLISDYIKNTIREMVMEVGDRNDMLLIGGDVADSSMFSSTFYSELRRQWRGGDIISVLGNHELWDGTTPEDWNNPSFQPRLVEDIVLDYRKNIQKTREDDLFANSYLLENELYVRFKDRVSTIISEEDIMTSSKSDLSDFLSKCTLIILGGIGYSGLNPIYNQKIGLYRKTINSTEEECRRTETFRKVYEKVQECAKNRKVIVLTHTPVYDWTNKSCNPKWIYVNGHTHQNSLTISEDGTTILSDNQIGYKPSKWKLHSFTIDTQWYDPFENYNDGIYEINSDEYREFNRGRGILCDGCPYDGTLYMLKRDQMYMFLLKSSRSLCLMVGGQRKGLTVRDVQYYYDNLQRYSETIKRIISPYQRFVKQLSEEVKRIGGSGIIHGCIVDISFLSHLYVNPFDGKITPYWALDIMSRKPYANVQQLLENKEPFLATKYYIENAKDNIPLIGKQINSDNSNSSLMKIPEWVFGTEMYQPSRIMKKIQYVWEQNVIRIWNDNVLRENDTNNHLMYK